MSSPKCEKKIIFCMTQKKKLNLRYGIMSSPQPLTKMRASHEHDAQEAKKRQLVVNIFYNYSF
jgi:hypothetical protein